MKILLNKNQFLSEIKMNNDFYRESKHQIKKRFKFLIGSCKKWQSIVFLSLLLFMNIPTVKGQQLHCCKFLCRDTTVCFNIPDSLVILPVPTFKCDPSNGGGTGPVCYFDSMWNTSPGVYPVGTTVVTWYVSIPGFGRDSCTQNIIRKPPSVFSLCFTTSPPIVAGVINICNGTPITFNANCSIGSTGVLWNFGNGYYSGNYVHTEPGWHYPPGTYYDTLTVYDDCGYPHDTAFTVVVDSASGPDIFCISVVCPGDTVTYHTSANCTSYNWGVSGGFFYPATPPTTSDSATVVWGPGPNGTISLSVSGCTPAITCNIPTIKTVKIVPATLPIFGDPIVCAGAEVTYCIECIPGNTHNWQMTPANAGTITGQGEHCITIKLNPTFFGTINLTVNYQNVLTGQGCNLPDGCIDDHGCGGSGNLTITVRPIFGISGPTKVCPNALSSPFNGMNLTNNTIEPLTSWKVRKNNILIQSFANTIAFNNYAWFNGPGIYQITAYAPLGIYCNDSAFISVEVVDIKIPAPILGPDTVCKNVTTFYTTTPNMSGVTYTWILTPPSSGILIPPLNGSSIGVQWNAGGGTLTVVQSLSASPFCTSAPSPGKVVKTWPNFPLPVITPSGPVACLKGSITYSIPPALISNGTYTWSVVPPTAGNIITANGTNQITIQWVDNSITPIRVKLKITRCYSDSVLLPVTLFNLPLVPNISFSPIAPCINNLVNFSTTSPGTWNWSFGDLGVANTQFPSHTYTTAGNYNIQLYVTNAQGCSDTAHTKIHVDGKPVIPNIAGPSNVCLNTYATYSFPEPLYTGASYTWLLSGAPKGTIISSSSNSLYLKWTSPGLDTVKVHVQSTCLDTIIKFPVNVNTLPTAGISVPSPACEGTPLTFAGSGGTSYSWLFTGGTPGSSALQNPVVNYPTKGIYGVTLTVTNANGCVGTSTIKVTINPKPIAIITGPFQICAFPATVTLSAVNVSGYSFAWTPSGNTPSISPTINAATTFSVIVTNSFGCTRTSNSITVDTSKCPPPDTGNCTVTDTINFTYTPPICLTDSFIKTGNATLTGWTFGDGGSAVAVSPVSHTFPYPGIFLVTVKGSAVGVNSMGAPCTTTVSKSKFITIPFDAKFEYSFQCNGANQMQTIFSNTSLYLNSASNYQWKWYDNGNLFSSVPFPGPVLISPSGPHVIDLVITDNFGTGAYCKITQTINVPVPITANYTVSSPVCQNSPVTFTDISPLIANEVSRLFTAYPAGPTTPFSPDSMIYTSVGTFSSSLTVTDIYGCSSTLNKNVTVLPASVGTITVDPMNCDSVKLTAAPGAGPFTWIVINPNPIPDNPVYVKNSGFYKVKGFSANGCPYTAGPVQVTVKPSPNATITGKTNYCKGEKLDIKTSSAGITITWNQLSPSFIGGIGNLPNLNIVPSPSGSHTYQVIIQGANGCSASATYTIFVDSVPPSASIVSSGPLTFCDGDSTILTVNPPGATYLWSKSPTPPLTGPSITNDSLIVKVSGTYNVIVQTANGCPYPAIPPVVITVNPLPAANITGDTVLCEGETLILTSTNLGGVSYSWTGPGGTQTSNPYIKPNMQLSDAGVYIVTVTDNTTLCSNSDTINVIVNPNPATPVIVSNPGGVLCQGPLFNLSVVGPLGPPIVYNWNTGQMGASINVAIVGDYYVVATNQFGCKAQSNTLTIHPLPDISCVPSGCYSFCNECNFVTIPGPAGFSSYTWEKLSGPNFVFYSATQNLIVFPPGGKYRLIAANQWGCADSSDTLDITFRDCCEPVDSSACKDTCLAFNDFDLHGFQPNPLAPNVIVTLSNVGSQGGASDYYISAQDQPGASQLLAGPLFNGKWCCGEFCFDYKLINDNATASNVNPSFVIRNGTLGFRFVSSTVANQSNGWHRICAPIADCSSPPTSTSGTWTPLSGTVAAQWQTVISYVTNVNFAVDYITSTTNEISGYDNICITPNQPSINAGPDDTICAGGVAILHVEGCNGIPKWYGFGPDGPFFINQGPEIDVMPTQTTCYMVVCCSAEPCCCDTDTVCVIVNPLPVLQWPVNDTTVCLNSAPIFLDASTILVYVNNAWVPVTSTNGTGFFSGVGVVGNNFYPTTLGVHVITYTYTDSLGCTKSITRNITVIDCPPPCFNGAACQIDAGPDQIICIGQPAILHVQNCNSVASWIKIGPAGNVFVGTGETIDVFPQQNTCYMVICCNPPPCCCDTDTVCIIVNPLPVLQWPTVYSTVCLNSGPIFLDASNILVYVNNAWVPVTSTTGTGVFSGINVAGTNFFPNTLGTFVITYTYTDPNGCVGIITNTIKVINCCIQGQGCDIDAGPDDTICAGQPAILNVFGCNSTATWYDLGGLGPDGGPSIVGYGNMVDVFPHNSTCYMVICCNPAPCCCDTDTVCIIVNPLPILQWPTTYATVCQNSQPIFLNAANILVLVNNVWTPVTMTGGTGFFSGPGVVGNNFYPTTLGLHVITYYYTDPNGCTSSITKTINVVYCPPPCDNGPSCQIDAGPDQTICAGQPAILHVQGCNSIASWIKIGSATGANVFVGTGETIDVFPQQNTCYMVICCNPPPCCCDTDTVCIIVKRPPILKWPFTYNTVCLNSAPVFLDASNIFVFVNNAFVPVTSTTGTGVFSGINVTGNTFNPVTVGTFVITYTYTDPNGCIGIVTNTITVINCCSQSTTCQVDAGPDQAICIGQPAILHVDGCNSTALWYKIADEVVGGGQNIFVGAGETIDVFPQSNTCYMVICCNPPPCCCDTDTVCITVNPLPILQWPLSYNTVCLNSPPIFLDASNIFVYIGNTWVAVTNAGGSGVFGGTGVIGNNFFPTTLGTHVITYYYTDVNGCTGTVTNTITVIQCGTGCDQSQACQIDAGPDQTICIGNPAVLNVQGCTTNASWLEIGIEGNTFVGQGQILDVFPQHSTCYMVICCNPPPCCCDTDTVCITVLPAPVLIWPLSYNNICLNGAPVFLNANSIFVWINNTWVSVTNAGGSGFFAGPGVVGNNFFPQTLGVNTVTYYYTDANGCTGSVTNTINVINCDCDPVSCNCNTDTPPPLPTITIVSVDPDNCDGRGCIHATFTGCCLMYSYTYYDPCKPELSYSVAQTNNPLIFCNLRAGTYTIYVQDVCGNLVQQNVVVPLSSGPLTATVSFTVCGGPVCINAVGGCPPYTYNWGGGNTSQCLNGAEPCTERTVTVTDSRGCTFTKTVLIPGISFTNVVKPSCCQSNGRLCANVCFGPKPYVYQWSSPIMQINQDGPCISGLAPGTYCLTVTNAIGQQIQCCYTLIADPIIPPTVSFVFNNCGSSVYAVIGETHCEGYTYHWENNSKELLRNNIQGCDSLTFTIVTCDGNVYNHGFKVPRTYPSISPVNCITGIGGICVPIDCFRCAPYTYSWYPAPVTVSNNGSCITGYSGFYTVCITNSCGDVICCRVYLPPPLISDCNVIAHLDVWIEGFYTGNGLMDNFGSGGCLHVIGVSPDPLDVDSIFVSVMSPLPPHAEIDRQPAILKTNGGVGVTFGSSVIAGNQYYIKINHRNTVETWSASPVTFSSGMTYSFITGSAQAYGNNMVQTFDNLGWAIYSGDINQDGSIDGSDFLLLDPSIQNADGGYMVGDLNGDGAVDGSDFLIFDPNSQNGIGISAP